jgi:hypothetical protein
MEKHTRLNGESRLERIGVLLSRGRAPHRHTGLHAVERVHTIGPVISVLYRAFTQRTQSDI